MRQNTIQSFNAGITGFESPASGYTEAPLDLNELLIQHPSATYIGRASGDSMQGDGIFDGDLLIISRAETPTHNSIIVANLNGEFVCKRLDTKNKRLLSANTGHTPYQLSQDDDFQIEGVVIRSVRLHQPATGLA